MHDYAATQVKKTLTGNGRAPKSQMQEAIRRELRLTKLPEPPDVADALAIALCHAWSRAGRAQQIRSRLSGAARRLIAIVRSEPLQRASLTSIRAVLAPQLPAS